MPLSQDQKKHLLMGGGIGAAVALLGSALFSSRPAMAGPSRHRADRQLSRHTDARMDNGRGEYGRKKRKHHKGHHHGH